MVGGLWAVLYRKDRRRMKKEDLITLEITDMGVDGEGIGRYDGFTFFVKDAVIGDTVEAKILKMKKNYGYARLQQVLKSSSLRREPGCVHARPCGGWGWTTPGATATRPSFPSGPTGRAMP